MFVCLVCRSMACINLCVGVNLRADRCALYMCECNYLFVWGNNLFSWLYIYWPSVEQLNGMQAQTDSPAFTNGEVVILQTFYIGGKKNIICRNVSNVFF